MVLAVTAEEGGTVADIQRRLSDLFLSADFPKTSAHGALPNLAKKGYVRLVDQGEHDSQNYYEITDRGMDRLRQWITDRSPIPAMRDAMHGKLEFAHLDHLVDLTIELRAQAKACQVTSDDAHRRMLTEQRRRVSLRRRPRDWEQELDDELSGAHLEDVKLMWEDIAQRRRKLADKVERIYQKHRAHAADDGSTASGESAYDSTLTRPAAEEG
jgi:DNA-binding PadR family transcriptional regulator